MMNVSIQDNKKLISLVFVFFLAINLASNGGHFDYWDGAETFLVTESMALYHTAKLDPRVPSAENMYFDIRAAITDEWGGQTGKQIGPNNTLIPVYTERSLFLSSIALPFYILATTLSLPPFHFVPFFVNPLILSLVSVVIFCFSLELYNSKKVAFILALIFAVTSFAWPYETSFFPQPLQTLTIVAAAYFLFIGNKKNSTSFFTIAGILIGSSIFAHPTSIIVIPGFIIYAIIENRKKKKNLAIFFISLVIVLSLVGLANYLRFGSITDFGYAGLGTIHGVLTGHTGWNGLIGSLVSPGAGLLFFFPCFALIPFGLKKMLPRSLSLLFIYIIVINWFYVGTINLVNVVGWSGFGGWGPRFLVMILPFAAISLGALLKSPTRTRSIDISIVILSFCGFVANLLGVLVWYQFGYSYGWNNADLTKIVDLVPNLNIGSIVVMTWIPNYSPILLDAMALTTGFVTQLPHPHTIGNYFDVALSPCPIDVYMYCKIGILPTLIMLSFIAGLLVIIFRELKIQFRPAIMTMINLLKFTSVRHIILKKQDEMMIIYFISLSVFIIIAIAAVNYYLGLIDIGNSIFRGLSISTIGIVTVGVGTVVVIGYTLKKKKSK